MHLKAHHKKRLYWIIILLFGSGAVVGLATYALRQNINVYFTPTQLLQLPIQPKQMIRLGGLVKKNSVVREPGSLKVEFVLMDSHHSVQVTYTGILPTLFREEQGVVVQGHLTDAGVILANQVLAKHDEKYRPPSL